MPESHNDMAQEYALTNSDDNSNEWQLEEKFCEHIPKTFEGLRVQVIAWLKGEIPCLPYFSREPYVETRPIIPALIALNKAGLYTHGSQPGEREQSGSIKRAWVHGWCDAETLAEIKDTVADSDLLVLEGYRDTDHPYFKYAMRQDPDGTRVCAGTEPNDHQFLKVNYGIARVLIKYHQVTVVDPDWARNDRLWATLTSALGCKIEEDEESRLWTCNVCSSRFANGGHALKHGSVACAPPPTQSEQLADSDSKSCMVM